LATQELWPSNGLAASPSLKGYIIILLHAKNIEVNKRAENLISCKTDKFYITLLANLLQTFNNGTSISTTSLKLQNNN
jgi:hypothetical protein